MSELAIQCLDDQPVIGVVEALGQFLLLHFMQADLVGHVYEVGWDVAQASAELHCMLDGLVCLVGRMAKGSDDEQLDAAEQWK